MEKTGSSPLTLMTCGLVLHSSLLIEIQLSGIAFNEFAFAKPDKIVNPAKNNFFNKSKHLHLHYVIFFIKYL